MKRTLFIIALLSLSALTATSAFAQDFGVDLSYMSMYVWRGAVFAEDAVFQPSLSGGMGSLSVNLWGNMDLTDENGTTRQFNEWDYTVDYSTSFDMIGVSVGMIGYTFPNFGGHTNEMYIGASYDIIGAPSITVYKDLEATEGVYASLSGGYSVPVADITAIDLGAAIGFGDSNNNQALYGSGDSGAGLSDLLVGVSATFGINDMFSVTPSVNISSILDSDGADAYDAADLEATNVFFGLTASAAF